MSSLNPKLVALAAQSIRTYLAQRPQAADTARGIHDWWIDWAEPQPPLAVTEAALARLEEQGLVRRVKVDSREVWRRA